MLFWTIKERGMTLTLCETCALYSTNAAFFATGRKLPAADMAEAVLIMNTESALAGAGDWPCTSSEFGRCGNCGAERQAQEAS